MNTKNVTFLAAPCSIPKEQRRTHLFIGGLTVLLEGRLTLFLVDRVVDGFADLLLSRGTLLLIDGVALLFVDRRALFLVPGHVLGLALLLLQRGALLLGHGLSHGAADLLIHCGTLLVLQFKKSLE